MNRLQVTGTDNRDDRTTDVILSTGDVVEIDIQDLLVNAAENANVIEDEAVVEKSLESFPGFAAVKGDTAAVKELIWQDIIQKAALIAWVDNN
jgi:hypothetical protein